MTLALELMVDSTVNSTVDTVFTWDLRQEVAIQKIAIGD